MGKLKSKIKMFEPKQGQIPGYTGHQRSFEEPDQYKQRAAA